MTNFLKQYISRMKGTRISSSPRPKLKWLLWSWAGSFLGITVIVLNIGLFNFDRMDSLFLIGSFGASAVLLYAAPQAPLSQPRNLLGGHLISALVGITISQHFEIYIDFQPALAVSTAIFLMLLTNTLHPPGGATALIAVTGGEGVHQLGYLFALTPVLLGALVLLIVALFINNLSSNSKRHYPLYWF